MLQFLKAKKLFILDLDGVLVRENQPLAWARETIALLKEKKKAFVILTNNSTQTERAYAARLKKMGFPVTWKDFLTSSQATLWYLKNKTSYRTAYIVGEEGLKKTLSQELILYPDFTKKKVPPDCVAIGKDKNFSYKKLLLAQHYILHGADFIATNPDPTFPGKDGLLPGAGALVAAVQACTKKAPKIIGKPFPAMAHLLACRYPFPKSTWILIGDRHETDIAFAAQSGFEAILVETGIGKREEKSPWKPKVTIPDLRPFYEALKKLK